MTANIETKDDDIEFDEEIEKVGLNCKCAYSII